MLLCCSRDRLETDPALAKVYRIHVRGGMNDLGMLVCVFSPDPTETLRHYLVNAAVEVRSEPVLIPHMTCDSKGIDVFIKASNRPPYYAHVNRKKIHPIDRGLMDEDR